MRRGTKAYLYRYLYLFRGEDHRAGTDGLLQTPAFVRNKVEPF